MLAERLRVLPPEGLKIRKLFQHASPPDQRQEMQSARSVHQESLILQNLMNLPANWFEHKNFHYLYHQPTVGT